MDTSDDLLSPEEIEAKAEKLVRAIGIDAGTVMQARICANLPPHVKIEQLFRYRDQQIAMLRKRLRAEHPEYTDRELAFAVRRRLDMINENGGY